jgi:flagellar protein FlbD
MLTRLNGPAFALNPDLIERAEATPDTVITLVDGAKYVVAESLVEVVDRIRESRALALAEAANIKSGNASSDGSSLRDVNGDEDGDSSVVPFRRNS